MKRAAAHDSSLNCRPHRAALGLWWPLAVCLMPAMAPAQGVAGGSGLRVGASVDAQTSYVVNSRLGGRDGGEWVAELRPGVYASSRAGRVVGSLAYGVQLTQRSRNDETDDGVAHNLNAQFSAEAIERLLYVDGTASVTQQLRDPFGARSVGNSAAGQSNRQEVATASLSPYLRGALGGRLSYELRLNAAATNTRRSIANDSATWGGSLSVSSQHGLWGWGLRATSQETDYRASRNTRNDRATLSANWIPDPDFTVSARAGEERTDAVTLGTEPERYANWGGGISWRPSPRTRMQLDYDKRYFGDAYSAVIEYRLRQTVFLFVSSRSDSGTNYGSRPAVTALQLAEALLAATISDPVLRQQQALANLQAAGIDPTSIVIPSLLSTAVSVVESHALNVGYAGRRISLGAQAYLTKNRVVDATALAGQEPVQQSGWTLTASYQINPQASVSLTGGRQDTRATALRAGTNLKTVAANLGTQLNRRATASVGARYSVFNSSTDPYREAAVTAALGYRF